MSGFLFVVPPLVGHINPAVGVADLLLARGHRVAWACADPGLVRRLAGDRAPVFPCAGPVPGVGEARRPPDLRGPEALKFLWEWYLLPLAEAMAPGVRAAVETFRPDVVVADQQAFSGGLVAERAGLPWATSATTSAEFADPLAGLPRVTEWLAERLAGLRGSVGDPAGDTDPRFSPHLVLAFSTVELAGPPAAARGGPIRWVGPSITARPAAAGFPWDWLDPGRATVLVTLGTANADAGGRFLAVCREALRARADRVQGSSSTRGTPWARTPPRHGAASRPRTAPVLRTAPGLRTALSPRPATTRTCWSCPLYLNSPCSKGSTPWSAMPVTTPCARRCGTGFRSWWRPSATTSRWWPGRWWTRGRASGSGSAG